MDHMNARETVEQPGALQGRAEYLGVVLDQEGVAEWEHGKRAVFVRRDELRDLRYEFGWRSERPLVQGLFGAAVLAVGLYMFALLALTFLRYGGVFRPRTLNAVGVVFPILGAWALFGAFRRGHFLRAALVDGGSRKFLLQGRFDPTEFDAFVTRARRIGYAIETS